MIEIYDVIYRAETPISIKELDDEDVASILWMTKKEKAKTVGIEFMSYDTDWHEALIEDYNDNICFIINQLDVDVEEYVYETCNYKGEGDGYVFASVGQSLPIYRGR